MKTQLISMSIIMITFFLGCEKEESGKKGNIDTSSISFTQCNNRKSTGTDSPSVILTGKADGKLSIKMINTEFCCGTTSVSMNESVDDNKISIEIIDNGPFTHCFCPRDIEFSLTSLDNKEYELTLIESEHAYSRDTFVINLKYSEQLDTIVKELMIGNYPFDYVKTDLGGCNTILKSTQSENGSDIDTLIFNEKTDTIKIFAGINSTCCITYGPESEIIGDTLIMRINTLNNLFCDCICYYTFDYNYSGFMGQGFYYKFYIDDEKRFEGKYNLP